MPHVGASHIAALECVRCALHSVDRIGYKRGALKCDLYCVAVHCLHWIATLLAKKKKEFEDFLHSFEQAFDGSDLNSSVMFNPELCGAVYVYTTILNFEYVCLVSKAGPGLGIQDQGPQGAGQDRPSLAALDIIDK